MGRFLFSRPVSLLVLTASRSLSSLLPSQLITEPLGHQHYAVVRISSASLPPPPPLILPADLSPATPSVERHRPNRVRLAHGWDESLPERVPGDRDSVRLVLPSLPSFHATSPRLTRVSLFPVGSGSAPHSSKSSFSKSSTTRVASSSAEAAPWFGDVWVSSFRLFISSCLSLSSSLSFPPSFSFSPSLSLSSF